MLCWRKINYKLLLVVVCGNMNSVDVDAGVGVVSIIFTNNMQHKLCMCYIRMA